MPVVAQVESQSMLLGQDKAAAAPIRLEARN
jgi:hypothetical protein